MNIAPRAENAGRTMHITSGEQLSGLRVSNARYPDSQPDIQSDEEEELAALMNADKRIHQKPFNGPLPGARSGEAGGGSETLHASPRFEPPAESFRPATSFVHGAQPAATGASLPSMQSYSMSHQNASQFGSIDEEKSHYVDHIARLQTRFSGRRMSLDTPLEELKHEYERLRRQQTLSKSIKYQRRMLMSFVSMVEWGNKYFNPFGLHLDGWAETVMDSIEEYDTTFEQLHDKYASTAEISPEWDLLLMILGSGFMFHLSNTLFRSTLPNVGDIAKQNPDLMQNIANAMSNAMGQPGMAQGGQSNSQMGVNLAMQAAQNLARGAPSTMQETETYLEEQDEYDEDESLIEEIHGPPRSYAPQSQRTVQHAQPARAPFLRQPDPSALSRPRLEEVSDASSDLSGLSEEFADSRTVSVNKPKEATKTTKGGGKKRARDERRALNITM